MKIIHYHYPINERKCSLLNNILYRNQYWTDLAAASLGLLGKVAMKYFLMCRFIFTTQLQFIKSNSDQLPQSLPVNRMPRPPKLLGRRSVLMLKELSHNHYRDIRESFVFAFPTAAVTTCTGLALPIGKLGASLECILVGGAAAFCAQQEDQGSTQLLLPTNSSSLL